MAAVAVIIVMQTIAATLESQLETGLLGAGREQERSCRRSLCVSRLSIPRLRPI